MLVLGRKVDECIYLSGGIRIMICGVDRENGRVSLGIDAPPHILCYRTPEILAENEAKRNKGGERG